MQKTANIKYVLYKVTFAAVLCAFFFVQTQAAFIAYAYNDFGQSNNIAVSFQKVHTATTVEKSHAVETHPKYKLNKRYQLVSSPGILPYIAAQKVYFTIVSHEWSTYNFQVSSLFLFGKPLRGPPCV